MWPPLPCECTPPEAVCGIIVDHFPRANKRARLENAAKKWIGIFSHFYYKDADSIWTVASDAPILRGNRDSI